MHSDPAAPSLLQILLRRKWLILAFACSTAGAAEIVVSALPVQFTAETSVALDAARTQTLEAAGMVSAPQLDLDRLRTEMEGFRSPTLLEGVVSALALAENPGFCARSEETLPERLRRSLLGAPPPAPPQPCALTTDQAVRLLDRRLAVNNDGRSYLVRVAATAADPALAAAIANAVAQGYLAAQRASSIASSQQADAWLSTYLGKLREQTQEADAAVARYREEHQLLPLRGETIVSQRLAELNSQLTLATSDLAQKQGMLTQMEGSGRSATPRDIGADMPVPALASPVVQSLLEQIAATTATQAELQSRYGSSYPPVRASAAQIERLKQQLREEVRRVSAGVREEVGGLVARRDALLAQLRQLEADAAHQSRENVRLQELQRDADASREQWQHVMVNLRQIDAERGLQQASAHIVVEARPPETPSFPRKKLMVAGTFFAALGVGSLGAVGGSFLSRRFRDVEQVESETGLPVLGVFPRPPGRVAPHDMVLDNPMSLEAEAMQEILIGLARRRADALAGRDAPGAAGHVIMVASAVPGEGKTSFALALGRLAAGASLSVALLDCDMRRPSLPKLVQRREPALAERSLTPAAGIDAHATIDERTGVRVIPVAACVRSPRHFAAPHALAQALRTLRAKYDVVVLDTPPVLAVPDALNLAPLADQVLMLASWRKTPRGTVAAAVERMRRHGNAMTGIVLTKVDLKAFSRSPAGGAFRTGYYAAYQKPGAPIDA